MSLADPSKQERIEDFLRKSLLGEELINTQFHLFSTRSLLSRRLTRPRVLCANNVLLAKSSKYFLDLLSSDINPSDGSLSDLTDVNDIPNHALIEDYGYASDSDLDDDDEGLPVPSAYTEAPKAATPLTTPRQITVTTQPKDDDELSEDGSESVSSDMFVMSPEHPKTEVPFGMVDPGEAASVMSGETAVQKSVDNKMMRNQAAMRLRSLGSRHILVKDTAFQTWYTLLNFLYTNRINFLSLGSATPVGISCRTSSDSLDGPRCSAKSMYRLACKVRLDHLRDQALAHIRSNLTEHNILKELSCSIVSSHPQLLEMELDTLYEHIASPPVVAGFSAFAQRIARKELPHGADIIVGIHKRLLKERHPFPSISTPSVPQPPSPSSSSPSSPSAHSSALPENLTPIETAAELPSIAIESDPLRPPVAPVLGWDSVELSSTARESETPLPPPAFPNHGWNQGWGFGKSGEELVLEEPVLCLGEPVLEEPVHYLEEPVLEEPVLEEPVSTAKRGKVSGMGAKKKKKK